MNLNQLHRQGEQGSVLIVAIIILVVLTLIGIAATTTTEIETQIAGNDLLIKGCFYGSESGLFVVAKAISLTNGREEQEAQGTGVAYQGPEATSAQNFRECFKKETKKFVASDSDPDVLITVNNSAVKVDVQYLRKRQISGSGAEFGRSGAGTRRNIAIDYLLTSDASGQKQTQCQLIGEYQYVLDSAGGI